MERIEFEQLVSSTVSLVCQYGVLHKEMWSWLADNSGSVKGDWPGWRDECVISFLLDVPKKIRDNTISSYCFACGACTAWRCVSDAANELSVTMRSFAEKEVAGRVTHFMGCKVCDCWACPISSAADTAAREFKDWPYGFNCDTSRCLSNLFNAWALTGDVNIARTIANLPWNSIPWFTIGDDK